MEAAVWADDPADPDDADQALALAFAAGRPDAFDPLYRRWAPRVTGYALRMLGRREDAEEVCVDTFTRVVEGRWRTSGSFRAWLFTVAHRACLERLRRRRLTERVLALFGAAPRDQDSPELAILRDERDQRLEAAIGELSHEHRAALLLVSSQGLSAREAGEVLGLTDQQVRSQLSYARRLLRERLGESEEP
jgi:RNA polymerase sigma-70 factor (ECF subfamily)